jgi:uncharacterized 2Fe-2S/4Fe-4S cluster protein (DUF4445 family)
MILNVRTGLRTIVSQRPTAKRAVGVVVTDADVVDNKQPMIVFMPSGKRGRFPRGTAVLEAARSLGVDVDSVCGGRAICGRCQVEVAEGDFAKHGINSAENNVTPQGEAEQRFRERRGLGDGRRLGCQARLEADVVIDVPASSQVHQQVVRKPHEHHDITIDPVVQACFVEVPVPTLDEALGDLERLQNTLAQEWQLQGLSFEPSVVRELQGALVSDKRQVTVAVRNGKRVIAVWPGFRDTLYGIAFDVGSTTVAAHLCNLASGEVIASAGRMNPQIRYGEDLMSRVSYIMMNPGGETKLIEVVREALNELIGEVANEAGIDVTEIVEVTIVGNPIMQHLVLGISPVELGTAPFALATDSSVDVRASDIGISINPGGHAYALPCIAGHVGADAAGVLLAEAPQQHDSVSLIVDVGTNAEILLGNSQRLLAASSPTGPAFEGAQISGGQRAAPGAIERVRIDKETHEPRFKVIGCDLWSDDPAFADEVKQVTGICGSGIIEVVRHPGRGWQDQCARIGQGGAGRTHDGVCAACRRSGYSHHAKRCAGDSAGQGRAARRRHIADGAFWYGQGRSHSPGRRFRRAHRCEVRDDPRADPGVRFRAGFIRG